MRLKFSLLILSEVSGNVLPITYQQALATVFKQLLTADQKAYKQWLYDNQVIPSPVNNHVVSNLYIPKIIVEKDRLKICVPRIQFWVSFIPEIGTRELVMRQFMDKEFSIGDDVSSVMFKVVSIEDVSPVTFRPFMEYQTLSPVVVKAFRANHTLEYLNPNIPVFAEFLVESLIERWEQYYNCEYYDSRDFQFELLTPERRKAVMITDGVNEQKCVGYMMKFGLRMSPILQEFAYVSGIGDEIENGFGYIELLRKRK